MSTTNDSGQAALPTPEAAYQTLFNQVHARAFFGKMAQAGYSPKNEKEANDLLELAGKLRAVDADPAVKAAADADSPFAQASAALDAAMADAGLDAGIKAAGTREHDLAVKQAAAILAKDPEIYNATLALKVAEAAQVAEAMQGQQQAA